MIANDTNRVYSWDSFVVVIFIIRGSPSGIMNYKYNDLGKEVHYFIGSISNFVMTGWTPEGQANQEDLL